MKKKHKVCPTHVCTCGCVDVYVCGGGGGGGGGGYGCELRKVEESECRSVRSTRKTGGKVSRLLANSIVFDFVYFFHNVISSETDFLFSSTLTYISTLLYLSRENVYDA